LKKRTVAMAKVDLQRSMSVNIKFGVVCASVTFIHGFNSSDYIPAITAEVNLKRQKRQTVITKMLASPSTYH